MTLQIDCSVGLKKETTYGTAVTVDRWHEFNTEGFEQNIKYVDTDGLRVGGIGVDLSRRVIGQVIAGGKYDLEWMTRGLGTLLEAMLGQNTSTLRSGSIYQQLATPLATDPMPCYTIQKGIPMVGGGATKAHTFSGGVVDSWKLSNKSGDQLMVETDWVCRDMATATAYAAPSYTASPKTLAFQHLSVSIGVNGTDTLTVPTATALGSTNGANRTNITQIEFTGKNNVDKGGFNTGLGGKRRRPVYGPREFAGTMNIEFDSTYGDIIRDYYLNQNDLHIVATWTSDQDNIAASGTYAALQVVIPSLRLEGKVPSANKGQVIETAIPFTASRTATNPTIYIVAVTADTAI